jgi:membrane protease YdiL (CAAX protease family)
MPGTYHLLRTWPTTVGLLVALGGPPVLVLTSRRILGDAPTIGAQIVLQMILCACAAFVVFVVLRWERLPLRSIGLRRLGWRTFATALLVTTIGFVLQALVTAPVVKAFGQAGANAGVATLAILPTWFRFFLATTSGIVEETLYRGYAVERFAAVTDRQWLGATLATAAFTAAHIPFWGIQFALVADLPVGILLVLSYLWRRDLVANMLAHSTWLVVALLTTVPRVS